MPPTPSPLSGFVLVGGRSSRFGSNKAFARVDGETLVERAVNALRLVHVEPYLVTKDPTPYRDLDIRVVDTEGPQSGPVAGWKAGLEAASHTWVLALSVDMPYVSAAVLRRLIPHPLPDSPQAFCFPRPGSRIHPFPGLYHRDLARHAASLGAAPSMHELLDTFPVNASTLPGNSDRVLVNINRPADFN